MIGLAIPHPHIVCDNRYTIELALITRRIQVWKEDKETRSKSSMIVEIKVERYERQTIRN